MSSFRTPRRVASAIECLESRTLLSVDLVPTINDVTSTIPAATISGDGTPITLKVGVANQGDEALARGQKISAKVLLHRAGAEMVELTTIDGLSISSLGAGASTTLSINTTLPAGVSSGMGHLEVEIDSANVVAESDEGNNTDRAANGIDITRGYVTLANTITSSKLPAAIVTGTVAKGPVKVQVHNDGNIAVAAGSRVDVNVVLRPTGGGADIAIGSKLGQAFGKVKVGSHKQVTVPTTVPAALPAGSYTVVATVTPSGFVADASPAALGASLTAAPAFRDLSIDTASTTYGSGGGANAAGTGTVILKNLGNSKASGSVTVEFFATSAGVINGSSVKLGEKVASVGLDAGKTLTVKAPLALPDVTSNTGYTIVARIVPAGFADSNAANDTKTVAPITVTPVPGPLGVLGSTITITRIIEQTVTVIPGGFGTTTVQHLGFVDSRGRAAELFFTWNIGKIAAATNAIMNFGLGADSFGISLNGSAIQKSLKVGSKLTFGKTGTIVVTQGPDHAKGARVVRTDP